MRLAKVITRALVGIDAPEVSVEVHISAGLPAMSIVGLPEAAVRESKDRVRAAIINSRYEFPARRITVNLAPADLPKEGGRYDLPIALGILAASGQLQTDRLDSHEFHGELALSGALRPVAGSLPVALAARAQQHALVMPVTSAMEASLVRNIDIHAASTLLQVCEYLQHGNALPVAEPVIHDTADDNSANLADVRGQHHARRALEVAAAGMHNLLMIGPPGTGKSMLASRLPGILPPMTEAQALESAAVNSISHQGFRIENWMKRPFRSPHHTASGVALVGGGSRPAPGEISLAHHGVLFLDELTEFDRRVLDVLREPMESGRIIISRAARQAEYPARFQLIAAMNPCPQGYSCDGREQCRCTPEQQRKYRSRISAPLLDRIDIHIEVPRLEKSSLDMSTAGGESSATVRARVQRAYETQMQRSSKANADLSSREIEDTCRIGGAELALMQNAMEKLQLSARAYHRILKLARTIADLDDGGTIRTPHITEAIAYRSLDRFNDHA